MACAFKNSLPLNTVWVLDYVLKYLEIKSTFLNVLLNGLLSMLNYMVWKMIIFQGYALIVDILIGALSLKFCQDNIRR